MKKNIEYSSISASLLRYLQEQLKGVKAEEADELKLQLENLETGRSSSLILELGEPNTVEISRNSIVIDELEIIPRYRKVIVSGEEIVLTPKEYDILYFLANNRGEIFTKEQIYRAVWEDEYLMDDSNIMSFIRKLRKKIEPNPDAPKYIITVWGIGYKFNDSS